jgi:serine/threonine protein kinase
MTLVLGSRIGRYEIRAPLGAGGMGEVYVAHDPNLGRNVAIKVLPSAYSADPDRLTRFAQEARAAGALNHPNVLAVYDVGTDNGVPYIVAELLDGEPLRAKLGRPFAHRKALDYAAQIARGLAAAHERGIVHRDLKPENVLITADGRAKIVDFGLAKLAWPEESETSSELLTRPAGTDPGVVLGTVGYMAPEQVRGQKVDHRADIFAFGCILYEMLAGRKAFWKASGIETLNAILAEDPPDLAASNAVPAPAPALQRVVLRCLEKSPAARFQSASDLAFALEALSSSSTSGPGDTTPIARVATRLTWRRRLPWLVAATAIVAAALAMVALMARSSPPGRRVRFQVHAPNKGRFQWILGTSSVISPDGERLALVVTAEGRTQLFVRALDVTESTPLEGTVGAANPFWSPDSRSLGFFAEGKLKRIEIAGGAPQTICNAPSGLASWGRDGTILFSDGGRILRVASGGGVPAAAAPPHSARHDGAYDFPYFLPDGRHFLYSAWKGPRTRDIRVGALDSPDDKRLAEGNNSRAVYAPPGYLLFVREGTLMAQPFDTRTFSLAGEPVAVAQDLVYFQEIGMTDISASNDGMLAYLSGMSITRLTWYSRDGAEQGVVGAPADYNFPRLSPDGQRLAVNIVDGRTASTDVWLFDLARGASSRFTSDPGVEWFPAWSPDGKRMAFVASGAGIPNLHVKGLADTGSGEPLVPPGGDVQFPWDWVQTPAGQFILYPDRTPATGLDVMVLPLQGERKPRAWLRTRFDEGDARVSPGGRWVAYVSTASGRREVYVRPFDGAAEAIQISTAGGITPRWRRDGTELYYLAPDGNMMAVVVQDGAGFHVGNPAHLFHVELARDDFAQYDVSADGQRFLVNTGTAQVLAVTVDVNWTAGLKP